MENRCDEIDLNEALRVESSRNYSGELAMSSKLAELADQLERWASESVAGSWSTHQVQPMRAEAEKIRRLLWEVNHNGQ